MKKIYVAKAVGSLCLAEDKGRDLYYLLFQEYCKGNKGEDLELIFSDVLTLGPDFFRGFFEEAEANDRFPLESLKRQVFFSGLLYNDILTLTKYMDFPRKSENVDDMKKYFDEQLKRMKSDLNAADTLPTTEPLGEEGQELQAYLRNLGLGDMSDVFKSMENLLKDLK